MPVIDRIVLNVEIFTTGLRWSHRGAVGCGGSPPHPTRPISSVGKHKVTS